MHKMWMTRIISSSLHPHPTLSNMKNGQHGIIVKILGGWHMRQSLHQVGIHVGDKFLVTRSAHMGGPMVIEIHSAQIALGRGMAEKIIVTIDENDKEKRSASDRHLK